MSENQKIAFSCLGDQEKRCVSGSYRLSNLGIYTAPKRKASWRFSGMIIDLRLLDDNLLKAANSRI
jgi:hypothetical protein